MLEVTGVRKRFGENEILKGVDLKVEQGDVIAILGPSGSGKTTLLRCIEYLERADAGQLTIDGRSYDLHRTHKRDILHIRRQMAFVFQNYNLFRNKTALENITETLIYGHQVPRKEAASAAAEALARVGLADRAGFYPSQLSGGQQQRVGIARAFAAKPQVILLDEPTSALDPELIDEVLEVLRQLAAAGTTMVLVTHELTFARDIATKVIFMEGGVVVEQNNAKDFFAHPQQERTRQFLNRLTRDYDYSI